MMMDQGDGTKVNYLFIDNPSTGRCIGQVEKTEKNSSNETLYYVKSDTGYHTAVFHEGQQFEYFVYAFPTQLSQRRKNYILFFSKSETSEKYTIPYIDINQTYLEKPFYIYVNCTFGEKCNTSNNKGFEIASDHISTSIVTIDNNNQYLAAVKDKEAQDGFNYSNILLIDDFTIRSGQEFHETDNIRTTYPHAIDREKIIGFPIADTGSVKASSLVTKQQTLPFDCYGHNNPNA